MDRIALIGSQTFAHQIKGYAEDGNKYKIVGYFDDFEEKECLKDGAPILGKIADIEICYKEGMFDYVFFAAGYNNFEFRERTFNNLKGKVPFANIIMDNVRIGSNVTLGEGVFIGENSKIGSDSVIEDNVFIHGMTFLAHDNHVGAHSYISGRFDTAGFVTIGKRNFMGIRSCISDHVTIADDVWIGLGTIVAKDIKQAGKYISAALKLCRVE